MTDEQWRVRLPEGADPQFDFLAARDEAEARRLAAAWDGTAERRAITAGPWLAPNTEGEGT